MDHIDSNRGVNESKVLKKAFVNNGVISNATVEFSSSFSTKSDLIFRLVLRKSLKIESLILISTFFTESTSKVSPIR